MLITILIAAAGAHRTLLQRLLGGWASALAFRREAYGCLDVSYTAAATLAPSRRCQAERTQLDELLLVTGLAPLLQMTFRTEPCDKTPRHRRIQPSLVVRCVRHKWRLARSIRLS